MSGAPRHVVREQPVMGTAHRGLECHGKSLDLTLKAVGSLCGMLCEKGSVSKLNLAGTESITLEESGSYLLV